ncbi:hypothetical protein A5881_000798 [Enterococcus termitis]|nr:hypothetical protein A5881_001009 [Enterococcus termitis]
MRNTLILLKILVIHNFYLNELFQTNKGKSTKLISLLGILLLILFFGFYNVQTAKTLVLMGEGTLIPAYMVAISSFILMLMTMFRSNGLLFASNDIEPLSALPVKGRDIIASKFLFMYLINLMITLVFILPSSITWFNQTQASGLSLLLYLTSMLFIPFIPMCFAAMIGVLIVLLSAYFKNKNLFSLLFSFLALCFFGYFGFSSLQTGTNYQNLGAMLAKQVTSLYPLAQLFLSQNTTYFLYGVGGFILVSALSFILFIRVVSKNYLRINELTLNPSLKKTDNRLFIKQHSKFQALYHKELSRFFASYMYILNTSLGVVLLFILSLVLLFTGPENLSHYLKVEVDLSILGTYSSIFIAALLSLSCTTAASISLEGKNIWIVESAPVSVKNIVDSKIAVNLTLHFIGYIVAVFAVILQFNLILNQVISLIFIPIIFSLFTATLGIFLNKKSPNYAWNCETAVVKQSAPVIITNLVSMLFVSLPVILTLFLGLSWLPSLWGVSILVLFISVNLYTKLCRSKYI